MISQKSFIFIGVWILLFCFFSFVVINFEEKLRIASQTPFWLSSHTWGTSKLSSSLNTWTSISAVNLTHTWVYFSSGVSLTWASLSSEMSLSWSVWVSMKVLLDEFNLVKKEDDFNTFYDKEIWTAPNYFVAYTLKKNNEELWMKYWMFFYDRATENWKNSASMWWMTKKEFTWFIGKIYWEIQAWITTLDGKDKGVDLYTYFNQLPLDEWLLECKYLLQDKKEYKKPENCYALVYFYRATSENKLCSKIYDKRWKLLCEDSLDIR